MSSCQGANCSGFYDVCSTVNVQRRTALKEVNAIVDYLTITIKHDMEPGEVNGARLLPFHTT